MKKKEDAEMNRRAGKGFVVLLVAMLIFTVVSRVADGFLVPQVLTEQPSAKIIEHIAEIEGIVESEVEIPVLTEAGIIVENVCVQEGEFVAEGDVLAQLMKERIAEQIDNLENEIAVLTLTNEAIEENSAQAETKWEVQKKRAEEDYARIVTEQEAAVNYARMELDAAEAAINAFSEQGAENAGGGTGALDTSVSQQQVEALYRDYFAKKAAYEAALSGQETAVTAAERAMEDAEYQIPADCSSEINRISIEEKEKALEELVALYENGARICAPKAGTVTGVFVEIGQKTTDTAAFTMASAEDGVRFTAEIAKEDAAYVKQGDPVSVKKDGQNYDGFAVINVETKEDSGIVICVEESATGGESEFVAGENQSGQKTDFAIGDTVQLTIRQQSERYPLVIPLVALHVETQGTYVYVLREKETVLGTEFFAEKVPVKVLEKNGNYAALEEGTLGMEDQVIIDSDRYIEAGGRVRMMAS